jgi:hypothetical protein
MSRRLAVIETIHPGAISVNPKMRTSVKNMWKKLHNLVRIFDRQIGGLVGWSNAHGRNTVLGAFIS